VTLPCCCVVFSFLNLLPSDVKSSYQSADAGYDSYLRDAHRQVCGPNLHPSLSLFLLDSCSLSLSHTICVGLFYLFFSSLLSLSLSHSLSFLSLSCIHSLSLSVYSLFLSLLLHSEPPSISLSLPLTHSLFCI